MEILESSIDISSDEYKENYIHYEKLVKNLKDHLKTAQKGGVQTGI